MDQSRFKLFEPYSSIDKNIFFGRDAEIYALYNLLQQTRLVLIYGASGTGKTSLIHAGLPKVFNATDWYRVSIRRKDRIKDSFRQELARLTEQATITDLPNAITDLHESCWIPIYLVFDQFEELFTLGNHQERVEFFADLQTLLNTPLPCKIILSMREEYIGHLYEYEPLLPTLFDKRFRVEPMKNETVKVVINQMCAAGGIELADGQKTADQIFDQLKEDKKAAHLPYLQVYLHYLYENALQTLGKPLFTEGVVKAVGKLGNVLKRFIETQLEAARLHFKEEFSLPDDFAGLLLDEFATDEGTKQAHKATDLAKRLDTEGGKVQAALNYFSEAKLLRPDEADVERYEPVHDVVAKQIHELRSVEGKEYRIFVRQLSHDYERWENENKPFQRYLTESDITKVRIYRKRLDGVADFKKWLIYIEESTKYHKDISLEKENQLQRERQLRIKAEEAKYKVEKIMRASKNIEVFNAYYSTNPTIAFTIAEYILRKSSDHPSSFRSFEKANDKTIGFFQDILMEQKEHIPISVLDISLDCQKAVTTYDDVITIWDLSKKRIIKSFVSNNKNKDEEQVQNIIACVTFSSDGELILIGDTNGMAELWHIMTKKRLQLFKAHNNMVVSVAFSPDNRTIATGSIDQTVKLWDILTGQLLKSLPKHKEEITTVVFSPSGDSILACSEDGMMRLWDISKEIEIKIFEGHTDSILCAIFSPDGKKILTGSRDRTAKLWNLDDGTVLMTFSEHKYEINSVKFSKYSNTVLTGGTDNVAILWNIIDGKPIKKFIGHLEQKYDPFGDLIKTNEGKVNIVCFSPDEKSILTGGDDNTIKSWSLSNVDIYSPEKTFEVNSKGVKTVAYSHDDKIIAIGDFNKTVSLWKFDKSTFISLEGHNDTISSLAFSPNGIHIATGSFDNTVKLWEVASGLLLTTFNHQDWILSVAYSPNGRRLLTGGSDKSCILWDIKSQQVVHSFLGHNDIVSSVAFSPDGKSILTGSFDKTAKLWDLNYKTVFTFNHDGEVVALEYSPNCQMIATTSSNNSIKIWNAENGSLMKEIITKTQLSTLTFSKNNQYLLSGSRDGSISIWNLETCREIYKTIGHIAGTNSISFSNNGDFFVTGGFDRNFDDKYDEKYGEKLIGKAKIWAMPHLFIEKNVYKFSFKELRDSGLQLEPEDITTLWEQNEKLTEEELQLIGKTKNKGE